MPLTRSCRLEDSPRSPLAGRYMELSIQFWDSNDTQQASRWCFSGAGSEGNGAIVGERVRLFHNNRGVTETRISGDRLQLGFRVYPSVR